MPLKKVNQDDLAKMRAYLCHVIETEKLSLTQLQERFDIYLERKNKLAMIRSTMFQNEPQSDFEKEERDWLAEEEKKLEQGVPFETKMLWTHVWLLNCFDQGNYQPVIDHFKHIAESTKPVREMLGECVNLLHCLIAMRDSMANA